MSLHTTLVEHAHCAEHGAWVHEGDSHAGERAFPHAKPGVSSDERFAPAVTTSGTQEADHDHCQVLAERRKASLAAGPCAAVVALDPEQPKVRLASQSNDGRVVYRFAPKTSPPA
jgi:hypothetical protein